MKIFSLAVLFLAILQTPSSVEVNPIIPITGISIDDVDIGDGDMKVTLSVTKGTLSLTVIDNLVFTTGDGLEDVKLVFTGKIAAVNNAIATLKYNIVSGTNGTDVITILVDDQGFSGAGGPMTATNTITVTLPVTNVLPVFTLPTIPVVTNEDVPKIISGVKITDPDIGAGQLKVTIFADNGRITVKQTTGLTVEPSPDNKTVIFTGTLANINLALSNMLYTPDPNFNGEDRVNMEVIDLGVKVNNSFNVKVNTLNDKPVITLVNKAFKPV